MSESCEECEGRGYVLEQDDAVSPDSYRVQCPTCGSCDLDRWSRVGDTGIILRLIDPPRFVPKVKAKKECTCE